MVGALRVSEGCTACIAPPIFFEVVSTRGLYNGAEPLAGSTHPDPGLSFAALTLGRTQARSLFRFLREGARLGPFVRRPRAS